MKLYIADYQKSYIHFFLQRINMRLKKIPSLSHAALNYFIFDKNKNQPFMLLPNIDLKVNKYEHQTMNEQQYVFWNISLVKHRQAQCMYNSMHT